MTQLLLFREQTDRPACTCNCGICHGECGCDGCQWDWDDEAAFQPVFVCCCVCGEVIAVEYEDSVGKPQGIGRKDCCKWDLERYEAT